MHSCSIRDLLRLALPRGTRLLTAESGLKHQIHHAVSLRATLPAFPALRGGELVVLSVRDALALDERLTLRSLVTRLSDVSVGALAYVGPVDEEVIVAADAADLPLLHLPPSAVARSVEREVLLLLNSPELQIERRAAQLYSELTQRVASGEGINGVLQLVSTATGRPAAFYDALSELHSKVGVPLGHDMFATLRPREAGKFKENGHVVIVRPVGKSNTTLGYVALGGILLESWDDIAADQAAAALALELTKQQAVLAVEARIGGELLQSIMSGTPADMVALQEQAAELGYDLRRPHAALLIAPADTSTSVELIRDRLQQELQLNQAGAPYVVRDGRLLCLYPTDERLEGALAILDKLSTNLAISAGVSKVAATAATWQRACSEAEHALNLGRHLFGPRSIAAFGDLQVYRLLFELRSSPELWDFYQTTLGPLIEYDRRHNAALLQTLEGYFAAQGNLSQAAERLRIHRNTLLYRLRRIGEIGNVDMERPEDALALQVALKAHRVLRPSNGTESATT